MKKIILLAILLLQIQISQLNAQIIVADYTFEGNAFDMSGNAYHGIVHGATICSDRFGNANSAYQFDGVNDYIDIPFWTPFNFGEEDFAISLWIKTTNSTSAGMILQKGSTSSYQAPQFWIRSPDSYLNNDLAFLTSNATPPSPYAATDTINIADGNWHHIIAQRNEKNLELYFDCHLVAYNDDIFRNINDNIGIIIGAQHPQPNNSSIHNFFEGCIDDITIYDEALNVNEIASICSCINYSEIDTSSCVPVISPSGEYIWSSTGTYFDTLSTASGCDSVITLNLTINQINTSLIVEDPSITASVSDASFQWLDCNAEFSPILNATEQTFTAQSNGLYAVEITQNACVDTSDCVQITTVSIEEMQDKESFRLYPNPAEHFVLVESGKLIVENCAIYEITGKLVKSIIFKEASESQKIDVSDLEEGIYMVKVGAFVRKLMVKQ